MTKVFLKPQEPEPKISMATGEYTEKFIKGEEVEAPSTEEAAPEVEEAKAEEPTEEKAVVLSKPEEAKEESVVEEKVPDDFQKRFDALVKRERQLYHKGRKTKDQEKELEDLRKFKETFEKDPYRFNEDHGVTLESWTKKILGEPEEEKGVPVREIETLKKEIEELKKLEEQKKALEIEKSRENVYTQEIKGINSFLSENAEKYPLANVFSDTELVFNIRAEKYAQDVRDYGDEYAIENLVSVEDAAQLAENYREEQLKSKKDAIGLLEKKLKTLSTVEGAVKDPEKKEEIQEEIKEVKEDIKAAKTENVRLPEKTKKLLGLKTLTNQQQTTVPVPEEKKYETEVERVNSIAEKYL